jgi:hypothetical protein
LPLPFPDFFISSASGLAFAAAAAGSFVATWTPVEWAQFGLLSGARERTQVAEI